MKLAVGVVVTALALFVFGFLYWAVNPLSYGSWNELPDPSAAKAATRAHFPATGVYGFPRPGETAEGMWAMIYVRHDVPDSAPDPVELLKGLAHYVLVAVALALVLPRGAGLGATVGRAAILGLAAVVIVEGTDVVWWGYPLAWKLWGAAYHVLLFVLGALVLTRFLPASSSGRTQASPPGLGGSAEREEAPE